MLKGTYTHKVLGGTLDRVLCSAAARSGAGYICILGAHRWPLGLYTTPTILGMGHQLPMAQTGRVLLQAIYTTMAGSSAACWRTRLTGS